MILKFLLISAVIALVYIIFFKKKTLKTQQKSNRKNDANQSDELVQCEVCDVYVDINEAILSNGKYYCSKECLKKA